MSLLVPAVPFTQRWPEWLPVLDRLLKQRPVTKLEWQNLFWEVHSVVSWEDKGAGLVLEAVMKEVSKVIAESEQIVKVANGDSALLRQYTVEWARFYDQAFYVPQPFRPIAAALYHQETGQIMVGGGAIPNRGVEVEEHLLLRTHMMEQWNKSIFQTISSRLQASAMGLVFKEREGEPIDGQLIVAVRESFVNLGSDENRLGIYEQHFEGVYLAETKTYYNHRALITFMANGLHVYMDFAEESMRAEMARGNRYLEKGLDCQSVKKLRTVLVDALVEYASPEMEAALPVLLQQNDRTHMAQMFRLLDMLPGGVAPMLRLLEAHITDVGLSDMKMHASTIVSDSEKYVEKLLALYSQFTNLVKDTFSGDPRFLTARDKAFRSIVNDVSVFCLELGHPDGARGRPGMSSKSPPESRCPELLANYCDLLLRKTTVSRKLTSEQIEQKLKGLVLVLKYVQNADVFMRYHQSHLIRRLIADTSADSEKEENMVQSLRHTGMPADYVNKLSRMFQDIQVSEGVNASFKDRLRRKDLGSLASMANIKILNHGAWSRSSERVPVSLPTELEDIIPEVEEYYGTTHSGRKLTWHHNLSSCTLTMATRVGKFELDVTTFQMAILYSWNQRPKESISFRDLQLSTELGEVELKRTLWSLIQVAKLKRQLLLVEPAVKNPREIQPGSMFRINHDFAVLRNGQVQTRGKISFVGKLHLATEKANKEDGDSIIALRILRLQEAIVKIMKMRKSINNAALQTELVQILRNMFMPTKRMIKEQIEWLIDNGYMKRDEKAIGTFIYVA